MSWQALAEAAPELAALGAERLDDRVAYLATLKADGSPRLHPVRPVVSGGHLFVFTEATSPKRGDLERDGRYMLHCTATSDSPWVLAQLYDVQATDPRAASRGQRRTTHVPASSRQATQAAFRYQSTVAAIASRWGVVLAPNARANFE